MYAITTKTVPANTRRKATIEVVRDRKAMRFDYEEWRNVFAAGDYEAFAHRSAALRFCTCMGHPNKASQLVSGKVADAHHVHIHSY